MDLTQRIWPRRTASSDLSLSLVERLKELCEEGEPAPPEGEAGKPSNEAQNARLPDAAEQAQATVAEAADSQASVPPAEASQDSKPEQSEPAKATVAETVEASDREAPSPDNHSEIPQVEELELAAVGQHSAAGIAADSDNPGRKTFFSKFATTADVANSARGVEKGPSPERQQHGEAPVQVASAGSAEKAETGSGPEEARQEHSSPSPAPKGPGQQLLERIHVAVDRAEVTGKEASPRAGQMPTEFQSVQRQFEDDLKVRIDGALAEFERRMASQALLEDIAEPFEKKIRQAADSIFKEVQGQAWMMHSAVAGELRSFRDQFAKEIQDRVSLLDRSAQQALQLKERLEETLPKAEEALHSLSVSGQEVAAKFQNASDVFDDHLRSSREALSREIRSQRDTLEALANDYRQEGLQLREELEKFRGEAGAACDLLGRTTDQSLERLKAGADEVHARARSGMEKLTTEAERRILSGGVIEKGTEQLSRATEEMVEPALERIRNATHDADSAAESLSRTGQRVSIQLDSARQEIDSRLESLLGEQLNVLETTMSGFQQKATEELGSLVERVVNQSTEQLDERLHGLLQDLFVTTSKQVNDAARTTLSTLHHGLKDVFDQAATGNGADAGGPPTKE